MNKKIYIGMLFASMLFVACGSDGGANSMTTGTDLSAEVDYSVEAYESLPVCSDRKDGQMGYVKGTSKYYVCEDGEWVVTRKSSSSNFSVSEDKPESGLFGKSSGSTGTGFGGYDPSTGILTDARDGQKYKTTTIGTQVWMAQNLNYAYLQPTAELDSSSSCYDNDPAMCKKYGRLYLWSAAMDSAGILKNDGKGKDCGYGVECGVEGTVQGVCPEGWHLPDDDEFEFLLESVVSRDDYDSANLRVSSWKNGKDEYGFSALPAGLAFNGYKFSHLGFSTDFWSSTESGELGAYKLAIDLGDGAYDTDDAKDDGYSVRCLKDN